MPASTPTPTPPAGASRWFLPLLEGTGALLLILTAALVPVFFIPAHWMVEFQTSRSTIVVAKWMLLMTLCGGAVALGAVALQTPLWKRYRRPEVLMVLVPLLLFLLWGSLAALRSPARDFSLNLWTPHLLAGLAAATAPLFLARAGWCRALLVAALLGGLAVTFVGTSSSLGVRGFNELIYGIDPRDLAGGEDLPDYVIRRTVEGGSARAGALSTLGNPEYAGSFAAVIAVIGAVFLFDWTGRTRHRVLWRLALLAAIGVALLHLAFSGSRQPWVAITLAGAVRLAVELRIPPFPLAAGFCLLLLAFLFLGPLWAAGLAILPGAGAFLHAWRSGALAEALGEGWTFNKGLLLGLPTIAAILMIAFSTPGPWNPTGLRVFQRFADVTQADDQSVRERSLMYMLASDMIRRNPFLGVGQGRYTNEFSPSLARIIQDDETGAVYTTRIRLGNRIAEQTHNDYLQIAAETGIPGLVFFLSALLGLLGGLWRLASRGGDTRRLPALVILCALTCFAGIMFTSFPLHMPGRASLFWMIVAAGIGLLAASAGEEQAPAEEEAPGAGT